MLKGYFNNFLRFAILTLIGLCLIYSIGYFAYSIYFSNVKLLSILIILSFPVVIFLYKKHSLRFINKFSEISSGRKLALIIGLAFVFRLIWIISVPTLPVSDFSLMYTTASDVSKGSYYSFHNYSYFARFTHNTITVLYFSLFYKLTSNPLFLIKFINVLFQTAAVYALYLTVKKVLNEQMALISAFILAVFPPFIMYTSETMSENMAMPIYIFAVYLFLSSIKGRRHKAYLLLSGAALAFANMFRMVGIVFIIAFIMYSLIYKGFKNCAKVSSLILIGFIVPTFLVSQTLLTKGITETQLWKPKEPSITSVLRGTNIEAFGRWNPKDAELPGSLNNNPEKISKASKALIIERLTTTPPHKLIFHYIQKLVMQWGMGDFRSTAWALEQVSDTPLAKGMQYISYDISLAAQLIYLLILYRAFTAIKNRHYSDIEEFNLFYILLGGFILMLLLTELQERYSFIAAWLFVIFAVKKKSSPSTS